MIPASEFEAFRQAVLNGSYNLLFGSGISLDSTNRNDHRLPSAEDLRKHLCTLTGAKSNTTLARVVSILTPQQIADELIAPYQNCKPGDSLRTLDKFLWRRLFTFNIDDVVENLYSNASFQQLSPLNYDSAFEPTPDRDILQAIHLHGWIRAPHSNFVFSNNEYARNMSTLNPWMHTLAEILATEAFVIAGTSLNEIDLEFYLSHRSSFTPRRDSAPSLLIDPYPDSITRSDCAKYGLTLVEGSFGDFLSWVNETIPTRPTVSELIVPNAATLLGAGLSPLDLLHFFSDFTLVSAANIPTPQTPSSFLLGREPEWQDINEHYDIERRANVAVRTLVNDALGDPRKPRLILIATDAGTGKTTTMKRVGHDLVMSGQPVLVVKTLSKIDARRAITCISNAITPVVMIVDNFADHADQVREIIEGLADSRNLVVLAGERAYRKDFVRVALGRTPYMNSSFSPLNLTECGQLINRYKQFGLVANTQAVNNPSAYAARIVGNPVAISICEILNDFQPLDRIVDSLWNAAEADHKTAYLCVALAQHCYASGIRYSLLQAIMGVTKPIGILFTREMPLRLTHVVPTDDLPADDYVVPFQAVIGERVLRACITRNPDLLFDAFTRVANALAPYVNRKTIIARSPEARLARRLFDADKVVKLFLPHSADAFYAATQSKWEWNSRYWEQRALFTADDDLQLGLQYARYAVAVERHPFALTTLGKLLLMKMEAFPMQRDSAFREAMDILRNAIDSESARDRITIHPFLTLFAGASRFLELNGSISQSQRAVLSTYLLEAPYRFSDDTAIVTASERLDMQLHNWT